LKTKLIILHKIMKISDKIRKIRIDNGLNQQNIADELGIKQSTYNKIETGKSSAKYDTLLKLAAFYKIHIIELISYGEELDEMDFVASKIKLSQNLADIAIKERDDWREQANYMRTENIELKKEIEKLKKTLPVSYSTEGAEHLAMVAEPELKKRKH